MWKLLLDINSIRCMLRNIKLFFAFKLFITYTVQRLFQSILHDIIKFCFVLIQVQIMLTQTNTKVYLPKNCDGSTVVTYETVGISTIEYKSFIV